MNPIIIAVDNPLVSRVYHSIGCCGIICFAVFVSHTVAVNQKRVSDLNDDDYSYYQPSNNGPTEHLTVGESLRLIMAAAIMNILTAMILLCCSNCMQGKRIVLFQIQTTTTV